jgi:hypothetical protein
MAALICNDQVGSQGSVPDEAASIVTWRNTVRASIETGGAGVERREPPEGNVRGLVQQVSEFGKR